MNVNQIVRIIPTLKVNNRKLNETFYIETLGMKACQKSQPFCRQVIKQVQKSWFQKKLQVCVLVRQREEKISQIDCQGGKSLRNRGLNQLKQIRFINYIKVKMDTLLKFSHQKMILILIHAEDDRASLVEVGEKPEFQTDLELNFFK